MCLSVARHPARRECTGRRGSTGGFRAPEQCVAISTNRGTLRKCLDDVPGTEAPDYKTNPPTSGNHNPVWYQDGVYAPGTTPKLGMLVHPLEHGRIEVQYKPGTPKATVSQLETLVAQSDSGYHMLLFQNGTKMPYAVAATAWGHALGCRKMNPQVWDALRDFRTAYIDKGPEVVP